MYETSACAPAPFMIVGDFNAHNPVWESDKVTHKDKVVKDVLSNLNLSILNDGSNTWYPGKGNIQLKYQSSSTHCSKSG